MRLWARKYGKWCLDYKIKPCALIGTPFIKVYLHEPALNTEEFVLQSVSPHKHTYCHTYHFKMHKILVCSGPAKQCILSKLSHVTKPQECNVAHTQELFTIFKVTATNGETLFYQQFSQVL